MTDLATLAYVRVSTEGQEEGMGLDVQRNAVVAYAAANGLTIAEWHQDVESGAKERRSGLDALRGKVAAGGIGKILVYRLDRIARDALLSETLYREWTRAGVRIISVSEAMLDDSLSGRLLRTILAGFAEYERAVIALRTSSGRKARVANAGTFHGGGVPYGYRATGDRRQPGHGVLAVEERHAEAVRRAFQLHDETRMTLKEIGEALNAEGYRTAEGALFGGVQVRRIIDRRNVYAGITATTPSVALNAGVVAAHPAIIAA
jgi:DNA invertase Pin-like site-specific DNA recombinase